MKLKNVYAFLKMFMNKKLFINSKIFVISKTFTRFQRIFLNFKKCSKNKMEKIKQKNRNKIFKTVEKKHK